MNGFRVLVSRRYFRSHQGEKIDFLAEVELQFLTDDQCRAWASDRTYPLGERPYSVVANGPPFACENFTIPSDAGARVALVRAIWSDVARQSGVGGYIGEQYQGLLFHDLVPFRTAKFR